MEENKHIDEKALRMRKMVMLMEKDLMAYKENSEKIIEIALSKLTEQQMEECQMLAANIIINKRNNAMEELIYNKGKLYGYLQCLVQLENINAVEMKALYEWFTGSDRVFQSC